jgi:hypothetical protein
MDSWISTGAHVRRGGGGRSATTTPPEQIFSQAEQLIQVEQQQCGTGRNPQACERVKTLRAQVTACREGNRQACAALAQQRR